ncbi:MAG: acyl-CoA dehydrogenase family protein [Deferribacterota bacterium]|nr:acyl-CoA dehydrogenase family protein [Deferribacterota bacterium]
MNIDIFSLDDYYTDEEKIVRNTIRSYLEKEIKPIIKEAWHLEKPLKFRELAKNFGNLGIIAPFLPEKYGCPGSNYKMFGIVSQEVERVDSALRSFIAVSSGLVMYPIYAFGNEKQKNKYLPKLAKGELIGCFGLTEPEYGSNPAGMKTTAKWDKDRWILNGSKTWITEADIADFAIVWARDVDDKRIKAFIVERGSQGFTMDKIDEKGSMRAGGVGSLGMVDCSISEENRLTEAVGLKSALSCLDRARYGISWGSIGAAKDCLNTALEYSKERVQFGKPIASFQLVQEKLVNMLIEIVKGELLCLRLSELMDKNIAKPEQISLAKKNNVRVARYCAKTAREILGANGISLDYSPIRHMANIETVYTYEGTDDIHTLILGRVITGYNAFN